VLAPTHAAQRLDSSILPAVNIEPVGELTDSLLAEACYLLL